jgi:moderate conductance mechanosensitive channel
MTVPLRHSASSLTKVILSDSQQPSLLAACDQHPGIACQLVWDVTHDMRAASFTNAFLNGPVKLGLRIAFVIILGLLVRAVLVRIVRRITERAAKSPVAPLRPVTRMRRWRARRRAAAGLSLPDPDALTVNQPTALVEERRRQRLRALDTILTSAISVVVVTIVGLQMLTDMDIDLTPLLASASVAGVAIGFGAQSMVKDYLAGILMLIEDQYGVGDVINIGEVTGTVEAVSLRTTRLRDVSGVVWHIPNGSFDQVGNESQGWARAVIDYPIPYSADLALVRPLLHQAADDMWHDPRWHEVMLEEPEIWGAQEISADDVMMRVVVRTHPLRQWELERELRSRIKSTLDAAGIRPEPSESSLDLVDRHDLGRG